MRHFLSATSRRRPHRPQALEAMPQNEPEGEREGEGMCHSEQGTPRAQTLDSEPLTDACLRDAQRRAHPSYHSMSSALRLRFFPRSQRREDADSLPDTWTHCQRAAWGPRKDTECCSVISSPPLHTEVSSPVPRMPTCTAWGCGIGLPSRRGLPAGRVWPLHHLGPQFFMCSHHSIILFPSILQRDCSNVTDFHPQFNFLPIKGYIWVWGRHFPGSLRFRQSVSSPGKPVPKHPRTSGPFHPPPEASKP